MNTYSACVANGSSCIPSRTIAANPFLPVLMSIGARCRYTFTSAIGRIMPLLPTSTQTSRRLPDNSRTRSSNPTDDGSDTPSPQPLAVQPVPVQIPPPSPSRPGAAHQSRPCGSIPAGPTPTAGTSDPAPGSTVKNSPPTPAPGADASDTRAPARSRPQGS